METSLKGKLQPRKGSDSSEYKTQPKDTSSRERSFSLVDFFKGRKIVKKDNSAEDKEKQSAVPPALPPKTKTYIVNHLRHGIQEEIYREVSPVDIEYVTILDNTGQQNQEETLPKEEAKEVPKEEKEEEMTGGEAVEGLSQNMTQDNETKNTHKRNISAWSIGSFHIGTPVELVGELLSGEEWAPYMDNHKPFSPDMDLFTSTDSHLTKTNKCNHQPNEAVQTEVVDGGDNGTEPHKLPESEGEPVGPRIDYIMNSVTIIAPKVETSKIQSEDNDPPPPLPPKLNLSPSSSSPKKVFRSSAFYKVSPGEQPLPDPLKVTSHTALSAQKDSNLTETNKCDHTLNQEVQSDGVDGGDSGTEQRQLPESEVEPIDASIEDILNSVKIIEPKVKAPKIEPGDDDLPHTLPPKMSPSPSSSSFQRVFRSSVFYKVPPQGEQKLPDPLKSGPKTVKKKKGMSRKSSAEETQLKDSDDDSCKREMDF